MGLRDLKKTRTRQAVQREAMRLFDAQAETLCYWARTGGASQLGELLADALARIEPALRVRATRG